MKFQNYILIIGPAPRTLLNSIHREIRVSVVTRLVELGQLGAFRLAQLSVFDATINQTAKTVVQKASLVARSLRGGAYCRSSNNFLDEKPFLVDEHLGFVRSTEEIVIVSHHF